MYSTLWISVCDSVRRIMSLYHIKPRDCYKHRDSCLLTSLKRGKVSIHSIRYRTFKLLVTVCTFTETYPFSVSDFHLLKLELFVVHNTDTFPLPAPLALTISVITNTTIYSDFFAPHRFHVPSNPQGISQDIPGRHCITTHHGTHSGQLVSSA